MEIIKENLLVSTSTEIKLSELKQKLFSEGLYFGYHPLDNDTHPLEYYLKKRIPNLYHYKYGSLSQLVNSLVLERPPQTIIHTKETPGAATGPDFNKLIIGSKNTIGNINRVTLRLSQQPESQARGILFITSKEDAKSFLRFIIGHFINPLFFYFCDLNTSSTIAEQLKIKHDLSEILLFSLSGLNEIVATEQKIIENWCRTHQRKCKWLEKNKDCNIVDNTIYNQGTVKEIKEQYRHFFWTTTDRVVQSSCESQLEKELRHV